MYRYLVIVFTYKIKKTKFQEKKITLALIAQKVKFCSIIGITNLQNMRSKASSGDKLEDNKQQSISK